MPSVVWERDYCSMQAGTGLSDHYIFIHRAVVKMREYKQTFESSHIHLHLHPPTHAPSSSPPTCDPAGKQDELQQLRDCSHTQVQPFFFSTLPCSAWPGRGRTSSQRAATSVDWIKIIGSSSLIIFNCTTLGGGAAQISCARLILSFASEAFHSRALACGCRVSYISSALIFCMNAR